jgi:hypothetical protein
LYSEPTCFFASARILPPLLADDTVTVKRLPVWAL